MNQAGAIDLVVLDMAGTTIEDGGQVVDAFTGALRQHQIVIREAELQAWRGASKREVLRFFVERDFGAGHPGNARRVEEIYATFRARLEETYAQGPVCPVAGAEATFDWLRRHGMRIALTTGFYRQVTDILLGAVGWDGNVVDAVICSDEVPQGRPAPYMIFRAMEATGVIDVRRVAKVGDTVLDLLAGKNAGLEVIVGVLSGSQSRERLGQVPSVQLLGSVANLPAFLAGRNRT
jgi:phosphonatase-like hydrolase